MIYCKKIIVCPVNKRPKKRSSKKTRVNRLKKFIAKRPLTYIRDPKDERDYKFQTLLLETTGETKLSLPSKVDHSQYLSSVKDQGQLGSCVAFAVTGMKEWHENLENIKEKGKKTKTYDLSEAWVYWNCKKIDPWPGEEGTSIRYAMKVLQKIGVPNEKGWPYSDVDFGKPKSWAPMIARWNTIESYWRVDGLTDLKTALVNGPVPIGIGCFEEIFYTGSDGVVVYPANPDQCYGGHAILAVAYNDSTKLIKFKNSWGSGWGDNGFGYISYAYVENFMWDAWASKDHAVTREMLKGSAEL